jgi:diguanylate cyclase (GGDEF)-like protein
LINFSGKLVLNAKGGTEQDKKDRYGTNSTTLKVKNKSEMTRMDTLTRLRTEVVQLKDSNARLKGLIRKLKESNRSTLHQNRKLSNLALKDPHTGLYNRRHFKDTLEKELALAKRHAQSLSLIMMDIDYFKAVNDVYGHTYGDLVLKQFTKTLQKAVRRYDILFRFGGEEFVMIAPRADRPTGLILAKRLLKTINAHSFGNKTQVIKLKVSVSVASYPEDGVVVRGLDLVTLADRILNKVKEYGGNKVFSSKDLEKLEGKAASETDANKVIELLKKKIYRLSQRANQSLIEAIFALAKTIGVKDWYSDTFTKRMMNYAVEISKTLKLPKNEIEHIRKAVILHDIGKVGINENILLKNSKLTTGEFEAMKKHPQLSTDIIRPLYFLRGTVPLILYHHERWDGKGYPHHLKGKEIPIGARIIAIVDAYRSLTSNRPYRKAYSKNSAINILKKESGTKFDPLVTAAFLKILSR